MGSPAERTKLRGLNIPSPAYPPPLPISQLRARGRSVACEASIESSQRVQVKKVCFFSKSQVMPKVRSMLKTVIFLLISYRDGTITALAKILPKGLRRYHVSISLILSENQDKSQVK